MKHNYLCCEVKNEVEKKGQLYLFKESEIFNFKSVKVIQVPENEEDVRVGDVLRVKKDSGHGINLEGDRCLLVHRNDIFYVDEA